MFFKATGFVCKRFLRLPCASAFFAFLSSKRAQFTETTRCFGWVCVCFGWICIYSFRFMTTILWPLSAIDGVVFLKVSRSRPLVISYVCCLLILRWDHGYKIQALRWKRVNIFSVDIHPFAQHLSLNGSEKFQLSVGNVFSSVRVAALLIWSPGFTFLFQVVAS